MEEPKKKPDEPEAAGTAGAQADALEESPAEEKREKAVNQGSTTTTAPKAYETTRKTTTKAAPLPESSTADLAAAARKAAAKKPAPQMADLSDDEIDKMAAAGNLGAVAHRKAHPRKK